MSFKIQWPTFESDFIQQAIKQLTLALNSGKKPDNIAGDITVTQLFMGSRPPELEILEISELLNERFKGLFKLVYNGDAFINIKTQGNFHLGYNTNTQKANPLTTPKTNRSISISQGMVLAHKPFVVPMEMKISRVSLKGVVVLVVDKEKGVTLVFKSDPLESVHVSSTFDNIPNIQKLLQTQIEAQLRNMFQEELPQMIHNLSLMFLKKGQKTSNQTNVPVSESNYTRTNDKSPNLPHHKKWVNNDPVYTNMTEDDMESSDGYVLYKTLSDGENRDPKRLGLHRIVDSPRFQMHDLPAPKPPPSTIGRGISNYDGSYENWEAAQGDVPPPAHLNSAYFQLGLPRSLSHSNFMSQAEELDGEYRGYNRNYPHFMDRLDGEIYVDDSISNVSPTFHHRVDTHQQQYVNHRMHQGGSHPGGVLPPDSRASPISPPSSIHKGQVPDVLWHRPPEQYIQFRPPRQFHEGKGIRSSEMVNRQSLGSTQYPHSYNGRHSPEQQQQQHHSQQQQQHHPKVTLKPSDNEVTAHLANLMTSHLTISPNTQGLSHLTFRGAASGVGSSNMPSSTSYPSTGSREFDASSSMMDPSGSVVGGGIVGNGVGERASVVSARSSARSAVGGRRRLTRRVAHTLQVPEVLIRIPSQSSNSSD